MIRVKEAIIVEGAYDKIKLLSSFDAVVYVTGGFSIMSDAERLLSVKTLAETVGIVILTDSDSAGFRIRSFLNERIKSGIVKNAYIPDKEGKEKRKRTAGKEGLLGVEGMDGSVILRALCDAGCVMYDENGERILNVAAADAQAANAEMINAEAVNKKAAAAAGINTEVAKAGVANTGAANADEINWEAANAEAIATSAESMEVANAERVNTRASNADEINAEDENMKTTATAAVTAADKNKNILFSKNKITTADLYMLGLSGRADSRTKREKVLRAYNLPSKLSSKLMCDILSRITTLDEIKEKISEI